MSVLAKENPQLPGGCVRRGRRCPASAAMVIKQCSFKSGLVPLWFPPGLPHTRPPWLSRRPRRLCPVSATEARPREVPLELTLNPGHSCARPCCEPHPHADQALLLQRDCLPGTKAPVRWSQPFSKGGARERRGTTRLPTAPQSPVQGRQGLSWGPRELKPSPCFPGDGR